MEKAREELNKLINAYGLDDPRTIEKSEQFNSLVVAEMKATK